MIQGKNITKRQGKNIIFSDLSFSFPDHGIVLLVGDNGMGKTSLLFIIALLDEAFAGTLLINGANPKALSYKKREAFRTDTVLYNAPSGNFLDSLNLKENVLLFSEDTKKINVHDIDLTKTHHQISGGEEQLLTVQRCFYTSKPIILFDEITSFLNDENTNIVMDLLKGLSKEKLIIIASHDPRIWPYADDILNMEPHHD